MVEQLVEEHVELFQLFGKLGIGLSGSGRSGLVQINGDCQRGHGQAVLFIPVGMVQLHLVDFFVDVPHDTPDQGFVTRRYFERIGPASYENRYLFGILIAHILFVLQPRYTAVDFVYV